MGSQDANPGIAALAELRHIGPTAVNAYQQVSNRPDLAAVAVTAPGQTGTTVVHRGEYFATDCSPWASFGVQQTHVVSTPAQSFALWLGRYRGKRACIFGARTSTGRTVSALWITDQGERGL